MIFIILWLLLGLVSTIPIIKYMIFADPLFNSINITIVDLLFYIVWSIIFICMGGVTLLFLLLCKYGDKVVITKNKDIK